MQILELCVYDALVSTLMLRNRYFISLVNLQERKPELTAEVMAFRDSLLSSTILDTLEVWELKGFHLAWPVSLYHEATISTCLT